MLLLQISKVKEITLVIPAKNEPNALPLVINEIKKLNIADKKS